MSKHRADKPPASPAAETPASAPPPQRPGRRRAARPPRRRFSAASVAGGAALLLATAGAVTVGQAIASGDNASNASSETLSVSGHYVATSATVALASRDASKVSRDATRPSLPRKGFATTKAERRTVARYHLLRRAAEDAEKFAKRLSSKRWTLPTSGFRLTELFGVPGPHWASGYHTGIDFATAYGTPVVAVGNGTVVQTGWDGPYGNQIRLQLPTGDQVWYNHLSAIDVRPGQPILKGMSLGRVGDTGNAFGYHLHFEYRLAADLSVAVDPIPIFREHGLTLQ